MAYKLLLADDSVTIQRVIELTFADEDVRVISVSDGGQAMDRIPHERPDIVLADVGMPQHDGYEVARFIKSEPSLAHIPVLLLTGAFEPVDEAKARAAGCDGVLAKPFEPQMLIARVKELLVGSRPEIHSAPERPAAPSRDPGAAVRPPAEAVVPRAPVSEPGRMAFTPTPAPPTAQNAPGLSLDEYFDKLDAAFANLSATLPSKADTPTEIGQKADWSPRVDTPVPAKTPADPAHLDVNLSAWMRPSSATPVSSARFTPVAPPAGERSNLVGDAGGGSEESSAGAGTVPPAGPAATQGEPAPAVSDDTRLVAWVLQPHMGDAFAALLASEQGESLSPSVRGTSAALLVSEAFVEEVTRRVMARLSDRVLRDTVADIVSQVAERVVREEIDRLKASLR